MISEKQFNLVLQERDQTFALMQKRVEELEAQRDALRDFIKVLKWPHPSEEGQKLQNSTLDAVLSFLERGKE